MSESNVLESVITNVYKTVFSDDGRIQPEKPGHEWWNKPHYVPREEDFSPAILDEEYRQRVSPTKDSCHE